MDEKKKISNYYKNNELDLQRVIDEYSGYVYKIIENMAIQYLSREDIEEILSDTFVVLWKNKHKLDKTKILSPYIAGITKNLVKEKSRVINIHNDIDDYENIILNVIREKINSSSQELLGFSLIQFGLTMITNTTMSLKVI